MKGEFLSLKKTIKNRFFHQRLIQHVRSSTFETELKFLFSGLELSIKQNERKSKVRTLCSVKRNQHRIKRSCSFELSDTGEVSFQLQAGKKSINK